MSNRIECTCGCGQTFFEDGEDLVMLIPLDRKEGLPLFSDWVRFLEQSGERFLERRVTRGNV